MSKTFEINIGKNRLTLTSPRAPDPEFFRIKPVVELHDDELFFGGSSAPLLKGNWFFKEGLQGRVQGVLQVQVLLRRTQEKVLSDEKNLESVITSHFLHELIKLKYAGGPFPIQAIAINGRVWAKYKVPVLGMLEYSTRLSSDRYLSVQFFPIDNTGEVSPHWLGEANELLNQIIESAKIRQD